VITKKDSTTKREKCCWVVVVNKTRSSQILDEQNYIRECPTEKNVKIYPFFFFSFLRFFDRMVKKDASVENGFHGHWDVALCSTCLKVPKYWCLGCFCFPCFTCYQRGVILEDDWSKYQCCQNYVCGCGDCLHKCTDPCPQCCACVESFCCPWCSLFTNRVFLQEKFMIANTKLEECIMLCLCVCSCIICILSIFYDIPQEIECCIDCIYLMFAGCFLSQQQHEWEFRMKGAKSLSGQEMSEK
jgi:hypothetical protein